MACYNNAEQVWWTIQALRMYQDLSDCEIVVVDNYGDDRLQAWIDNAAPIVKYVRYTDTRGTAAPRNKIFDNASGEFVLVIDSHVMLAPNAIKELKEWIETNRGRADLFHGPMIYDGMTHYVLGLEPKWESNFFGVWTPAVTECPTEEMEIQMHGMGLFGAFKDKWLRYNDEFVGFGGEEGYIHEKYRQHGHKVILLPMLKWMHRFHDQLSTTPYKNIIEERIRNYVIGWTELGKDITDIQEHFKAYNITLEKKENQNILNINFK